MTMKREPVVTAGLVLVLVNATLILVNAMAWFPLTIEQMAAINGFAAALLSVAVRAKVTPVSDPRDNEGRELVPRL